MTQLPNNNLVILAAAGSRKTTSLVEMALADPHKKVLLTTYTNENLEELKKSIIRQAGVVPNNVTIKSLFSFLFQDGVRPYQNHILARPVESIDLVSTPSRFTQRANVDAYYVNGGSRIYAKYLSDFMFEVNRQSGGLVIDRLERIYDAIYVDEVQDLNGYDLDVLDLLFSSQMEVAVVGDPRQWTYASNTSNRHKRYRGPAITAWFEERERDGRCTIERRTVSYRCNQLICDFADRFYPQYPGTRSESKEESEHVGLFSVASASVAAYVDAFRPQLLRYDRTQNTYGYAAVNFGLSKGRSYDHVLVIPNGTISRSICTGDYAALADVTKAKLYVAVTRARHSVAFVCDHDCEPMIAAYQAAP